MKIIAKTLMGLENALAKEIIDLGVENIEVAKRAIIYEGNLEILYKSNLFLRSAIRILVGIEGFTARNENELYEKAKSIKWQDYLGLNQTFAIDTNVNSDIFTHSKYVAYKIKDAIADYYSEKYGRRPNVNTYDPDVKINVSIYKDKVKISLDSSGESLHRRGYKVEMLDAPLSEVLAAGILLQTGFEAKKSFLDPMCGSGTFVTEALMINTNTAPNLLREKFGFMNWLNYERRMWNDIKDDANKQIKEPDIDFNAYDISRKAVFATKKNLSLLQYGNHVNVIKKDFFKLKDCSNINFIIMNPPYDIRLKEEEIILFYQNIGDKLKQDCAPCDTWVISGNIEALKRLGLKPSKKVKMMNGKIEAELRRFEVRPRERG
jgi:putative N6-adenine-specific DNA methylase